MSKIFKFFESKIPRYLYVRNELFLLYLRGIRGIFEKRFFYLTFFKPSKILEKGRNPTIFIHLYFPSFSPVIVLNILRIN